jgi:predicted ester cyclase
MSINENKATIRRIWKELMQGNLEIIDECFTANFIRYAHDGTTMDISGYKDYCSMINKNSPRVTIDDMVAEGDKVAFRITFNKTNGKPLIKETYFARFEGGKVAEYVNLYRMLD